MYNVYYSGYKYNIYMYYNILNYIYLILIYVCIYTYTHTLSYNCTRDTPSATWVTKEAYLILPHGVFARKVSWLSSTYEKMIMEETVNLMLYILSMNKQIKHTPPKTTHGTSKCWFPKKGISFSRGGGNHS